MPETLVVELDDEARCCNPSCRAQIEAPGSERRYCPRCGQAQVYECEACPSPPGGLLRVAQDCECPRCGALYVTCAACQHPVLVRPEGPLSCPEGCAAELVAVRTGTHEPLANVRRTGSVVARRTTSGLPEPARWRLREPVSRAACRFGRVFVATARGTIRALEEDTGRDVETWTQPPVFQPDPATLEALGLRVGNRYVYFVVEQTVTACFAGDGAPAFGVQTALREPQAVMSPGATERLLICGLTAGGGLGYELYDVPALQGQSSGLVRSGEFTRAAESAAVAPDAAAPKTTDVAPATAGAAVSVPAATPDAFLVVDAQGNILEVPLAENKESRTLWANPGYDYVSTPAVVGRWAYLLAHSVGRGAAVGRLALAGGSVAHRRVPGLTPAYIGLRATSRALYLCDGERDFYELDLAKPSASPRPVFAGVAMVGDVGVTSLVAVETGGAGAWLVYLVGSPGSMTPRMVHTATAARPDLPAPAGPGHLGLAVSDAHILVSDLQTGEVLVYQIPEGG